MLHRARTHRKKSGSGIRRVALGLLGLSLLLLALPQSWTAGLMSLVQVLVPFQDGASWALAPRGSATAGRIEQLSQAEVIRIAKRSSALEHTVSALSLRVAQLEAENDLLSGTRLWDPDGRRFGASGRLIPGRVIVSDMVPWRQSRLLNAGTLQGVRRGQGVISHHFSIDRGHEDGVVDGMAILLKESLIGFVADTGTHTSRIRLLGDVNTQMKVRIARIQENGPATTLDRFFWLTGTREGLMVIHDVERRDVEAGLIQVDDIVLAPPVEGRLPTPMCVGQIRSITVDRENPLLNILRVESRVNVASLSSVFVFQPDTE